MDQGGIQSIHFKTGQTYHSTVFYYLSMMLFAKSSTASRKNILVVTLHKQETFIQSIIKQLYLLGFLHRLQFPP